MKNLNDELAQKNREAESEKISALSRINSLEKDKQNLLEAEEESAIQIEQYASKLRQLEKENKRLDRDNKALELEKKRLTEAKLNAVNEKTVAKNAVSALTREIEWLRKQTEQEQSNIFSLVRDREMMKNSLKLVDEVNTKNKEDLKQAENVIIALKDQNRQNKESLQVLSSETQKLDKEREKFSQEAAKANSNLMQMVEEVKLKKNLIGELKKETIDLESKLKQQQNLYEAVRSDRNLYSKNLIEAQDEVAELKRKFKIASH
jgi:chromosome segregation ATPase